MKHKIKKILVTPKIAISVAFFIALALGMFSYINHKNTLNERFADISTIPLGNTYLTSNNTSPKDLTLAFPVGGRIKKVLVKIGDKVTTGTLLASLDAENAVGAVNQARAAYKAAQTAYEKLVNGASTPDIDVAKVALNNAKNTYTTTIAQQKVSVANALSAMLNSG